MNPRFKYEGEGVGFLLLLIFIAGLIGWIFNK